jgi:hypothetical protein
MSRLTYWLALAWTAGVTTYLVVAPIYGEKSTWMETTPSGAQVQHTDGGTATLIDVNGPHVLAVLAIPLALVVAPMLVPKPRRRPAGLVCGILLLALAFLGSFSIGMLYYPSALALLISAASIRLKKA